MSKILVVDDNELACEALSMVLEAHGYTVDQAHRVAEAIEIIKTSTDCTAPDLAIIDLSMPDGNGVDLIHSLHKFRPSLPIILYSGYFTPENDSEKRANAIDGIVAVFKKPIRNAELLATIEKAISQ